MMINPDVLEEKRKEEVGGEEEEGVDYAAACHGALCSLSAAVEMSAVRSL